jgi:hypothetical protein
MRVSAQDWRSACGRNGLQRRVAEDAPAAEAQEKSSSATRIQVRA